jgi:hypothetical protein
VEESKDAAEMKEVKTGLLLRFRGEEAGPGGLGRYLELRHQSEMFEEAATVLATLAKIACCSDLAALKEVAASLRAPNDIKELLKAADEKLGKDLKGEELAPVAVGAIDAILAGMPNGGSYLRDMVQLEKDSGLKEGDRLLIKVCVRVGVCGCGWVIGLITTID